MCSVLVTKVFQLDIYSATSLAVGHKTELKFEYETKFATSAGNKTSSTLHG
jgi:hypothetical protein